MSKRSWIDFGVILEAEMGAKVHPKGEKNEDETRTKFKSGLKQQHLILNDTPMKIADF